MTTTEPSSVDGFAARLAQATRDLRTGGQALDRHVGEAHAIGAAGKNLQAEIAALRTQMTQLDRVSAVLATVGEDRQHTVQTQIETLVTQALATIFGAGLSFHLVAALRAKNPVIDFVVRSKLGDQVVDTDIMDARGGGLAATVGFLLRLVVLLLRRRRTDTVLCLDETFAHVSVEYQPRLAEFLRELVDKTGVQVVLVTHSDTFAEYADTRYRFTLKDGVTVVSAV